MFTRAQFLSCCGFLEFWKVIKGDWQEMLPGTWSVLIDGRGSAVPGQAAAGRRHLGSIRLRLCSFLHQLKAPQRWAEDWAGAAASPRALCFSERGVGGQPLSQTHIFERHPNVSPPTGTLGSGLFVSVAYMKCKNQTLTHTHGHVAIAIKLFLLKKDHPKIA